jgi:hypothetical protein
MDVTRRKTIAAVLAGGLGAGVGLSALSEGTQASSGQRTEGPITNYETEVLTSLAEVVYPSTVSGHVEVVEGYLDYQPPARLRAIRNAVHDLDRAAKRRYGNAFATLEADQRETLLRELGVDRAGTDASGSVPERVRSLLVNSLLYALFTDPAGSRLVGIENPRGYPGGYEYTADHFEGEP